MEGNPKAKSKSSETEVYAVSKGGPGEGSSLVFGIDPGRATVEQIRRVLRALNVAHQLEGGAPLLFKAEEVEEADDTLPQGR